MSRNVSTVSRKRTQSSAPQLHRRFCTTLLPRMAPADTFIFTLQKKADTELARAREADKAARSYDNLFTGEEEDEQPQQSVQEMMDDFM